MGIKVSLDFLNENLGFIILWSWSIQVKATREKILFQNDQGATVTEIKLDFSLFDCVLLPDQYLSCSVEKAQRWVCRLLVQTHKPC